MHNHPYCPFGYPCTQMEPPEVPDRKRNVVLYLNPHLVQEAKDRGINLSRFVEYDLRLFLNRMKQSNLEYAKGITGETESAPAQNDPQRDGRAGWCGGWEPRTSLLVKARAPRAFPKCPIGALDRC